MSALRRYLMGWATHTAGIYRLEKAKLQTYIDTLDVTSEERLLSEPERVLLAQSRD